MPASKRPPVSVFKGVLVFLLLVGWVRAGDFETGNELFEQGKFADAKQHYENLVEVGQAGANVFYNLGNADFRLGSPGRAMLNYERALALQPQHPEALANLNLLRQQLLSKLPPESWPWLSRIYAGQTLNYWMVAATVCGWLVVFSIALLVTSARSGNTGLWFLLLLGGLGLLGTGAGVWLGMKDQSLAVITAKEAQARLAPAEGAGVAELLPAGSRVHVLSERGAWTYCELPGTGRGWIPQGMVERVRPDHT